MAAGVVTELVAAMSAAGADPARMHAVIGPHICGGCYEVPEQMRARIAGTVPEAGCVTRAGTPGIDIGAGIEAQLARAGRAAGHPRPALHRRDSRAVLLPPRRPDRPVRRPGLARAMMGP